jgi:hypothetical protein
VETFVKSGVGKLAYKYNLTNGTSKAETSKDKFGGESVF